MRTPSKTLVIRFSSVGDVVLSTPLLRAFRRRFPESQLDFLTRKEYAPLVKHNPNLNLTYEYDASSGFGGLRALKRRLKRERYDLVLDLHNSIRSRYLRSGLGATDTKTVNKRVIARAALVYFKVDLYRTHVSVADRYLETVSRWGVEADGRGPELHLPDETIFGLAAKVSTLQLHRFEKVVGLCPSARHATKRWPPERWAALGSRFATTLNGKVLIFGGPDDRELNAIIAQGIAGDAGIERVTDWTGQLELLEAAAAMQYCDVIVTNDTGLMHIAAAMHRPLVALFGSTVRQFGFYPFGEESEVLEVDGLYCRPCSHIGRASCPQGHFRCMMDLSVDRVWEVLLRKTAALEKETHADT